MARLKSAKAKGTSFETQIRKDLEEAGATNSRRQPLSGALDAFPGDVILDPQGWALQIECKHHKTISHYDRYEKARLLCDGAAIETGEGRFYWLTHDCLLDLVRRSYAGGGLPVLRLASLKVAGSNTVFEGWRKGCDLLVVKPNHKPPRWWVPEAAFWDIANCAAQGAFTPEVAA